MRTLDLLASDSSHLPFLYVFKESKVMEKYGFEIDLHIVGGAKAPTMAHRAKLALAGEIDFLSGLHHETYRERAKGEKRLTYLAQAQNNWDDRLVVRPEIKTVEDLKGKKIVCHSKAPCVSGNLRAVLQDCGLKPEEINMDVIDDSSGKFLEFVDEITSGKAVGALVDMPFDLYGIKKGLHILALPDRPVIHNTTLLATSDYIKENPETVDAFLKGLHRGVALFQDKAARGRADPQEESGRALRFAGGRILRPLAARVGQATEQEALPAARGNPKCLRPRRRQRSQDAAHRTDGTVGFTLSAKNRRHRIYR